MSVAIPYWALHVDGTRLERLEDIPRKVAAAMPDAVAVIEQSGITTWAQLDEASNRAAAALVAAGVREGDRVCYVGENSMAFLTVLYGASKAGAVPMPVNFRLATTELEYIVRDAGPRVIVLGPGMGVHESALASIEDVRVVVRADDGQGGVDGHRRDDASGAGPDGTQIVNLVDWLAAHPAVDPGEARAPSDTAVIFYTSGTTGRPKGIELTGHNIGTAVHDSAELVKFDPGSVSLAPIPFFHVAGFGLLVMANLAGASLLLINPTSPDDLLRILQDHKVSHAVMVPTVIQFLVGLPEARAADWSRLRWILYGGAPMPEPVAREAAAVLGCDFLQGYGLTESTGGVCNLGPEDHRPTPETAYRLHSVGRVGRNNEIKIIDPLTGAEVPAGERGEVLIRGNSVMKGYWRQPDLTAATIDEEGWLHTGDGGSLDADGYLFLHDRLKDMIVTGGENVYPAEVESVLTGHPEVAQVAVIGVPSRRWGEVPMAVVVRTPGATLEAAELITWARERIAHFKCPADVAFVDALPLNASGKLLKVSLRERYSGAGDARVSDTPGG